MTDRAQSRPQAVLSGFDAVVIMVGLVVGVGIFRTPSIVAASVDSEWMFIGVWVVGGLVTLIGALCYAELAAAYPSAGGEYHFLSRAYGRPLAMLFGWARCTVIQTGAIAGVAFVLGDYLSQILPLGDYGSAWYAALAVMVFTAINTLGTVQGKRLQVVVTFIEIGVLGAIIALGLFAATAPADLPAPAATAGAGTLGMAMIFVLLTYGGWNEAAYLTGELKDARRSVARVLIVGTLILMSLYALANWALLSILGLEGLRRSDAVVADMMRVVAGAGGELIVTLAIVIAAISTLNATIFTGARVFYAMAGDLTVLRWVGVWRSRGTTPANAQVAQAALALALIGMGAVTRDGFKAMVDYTAPVFWGFLFLVAVALFILRRREPDRKRVYSVPFYPLTPLIFCLTCLYMFYASIVHTGSAALLGLLVLAAGTPLLLFQRRERQSDAPGEDSHVAVADCASRTSMEGQR